MILPMSLSELAEIEPTWAISLEVVQGLAHGAIITSSAEFRQPFDLLLVRFALDFQNAEGDGFLLHLMLVDADPDEVALFHSSLKVIRGVGDFLLEEPALDGGNDSAFLFDTAEVFACALFHLVGHPLHEVGATERVYRVRHSRLLGDYLLGAKREQNRLLRGERPRLVERVHMQGLRTA